MVKKARFQSYDVWDYTSALCKAFLYLGCIVAGWDYWIESPCFFGNSLYHWGIATSGISLWSQQREPHLTVVVNHMRHDMETFSLLAICEWNSQNAIEKKPQKQKQSSGWWSGAPLRPRYRIHGLFTPSHCIARIMRTPSSRLLLLLQICTNIV